MVSLRFPFWFSRPPNLPKTTSFRRTCLTTVVGSSVAAAGIAAGVAITQSTSIHEHPFVQNTLSFILSNFPFNNSSNLWASLSFSVNPPPFVDPKTGLSFPSILNDSQRLLGVGLRRKSVFGLKNIDVYAFGVYADDGDLKKYLDEKCGKLSISELKVIKELNEDLMESDVSMTIRLQIVYGKLSIRSVRSAFEESIGSRLQKFGGTDNKELLRRFTAQFKDEYKIPKGSVIELAREHGHVLRTRIDGKEVGSIQSKVLCRSLLDLYIGEQPFDEQAKEDVKNKLVSILDEDLID
ncbi:hypothetical protein Nepgr_022663 [Nepenthes gracilis]|uniref:Chalcone isomerase domain-containing protein n=1 Tax=Nepenthes gracilis TaxID=150966 RepID=A0AAD3XYM5_NEPGR|nr:hypothetical protein Nepgr_022663 [Nepenthes gracilis]